ncbi:GTP-binding protein, partial [Candidatus Azambacteria bacterium]|nr:GTP-binding protein [Candidatus Azambacteria bacterium]
MKAQNNLIRNFCIIAHIDHGKSTLADRFLEFTKTIDKAKMQPQILDMNPLERERGITIKMQPVRMVYHPNGTIDNSQLITDQPSQMSTINDQILSDSKYILNLIDTPGHADFGYEVSRALKAVEGAILLVDATQGIQAQTIFNYEKAVTAGLTIIPVINKIDLYTAKVDEVKLEIIDLLKLKDESEILTVSAKTGQGVKDILEAVIKKIPAPQVNLNLPVKALIFDSIYDSYLGVIAFVRIFLGTVRAGETIKLMQKNTTTQIKEVGIFNPRFKTTDQLSSGEIGYIATGLKDITQARVGETITTLKNPTLQKLLGYDEPKPVIFASFYSSQKSDFNILSESIKKLNLNDPAFQVEEERSVILGRGYRCGFLGILHLDIIRERLKQEFKVEPVILSPSVNYKILLTNQTEKLIYTAEEL